MRILEFPLKPLIYFRGKTSEGFLTDHNRSELSVSYEEVGNTGRTASGSMRGYVVARKRSWTCNWSMVPGNSRVTIDGFWSINELESFYRENLGVFDVSFYRESNAIRFSDPIETVQCRFTDLSFDVVKRGIRLPNGNFTDFCDFSCSWEEV